MRTEFGPGTSPDATGTSDVHILHAEGRKVVLPSSDIMLESMYARVGADLVITSPEHGKYVVKGFFLSDKPPILTDGHHTHISGDVAAQFAGPIAVDHYAGQAAANGASIGQVRSLVGVVQVDRGGTTVTLKVGDPVYQNDEISTQAGAKLGLILIDGTVLALGEKGELVLDELVYDPSTKGGNAALRLVSGAAEFVSGSIAKSGQDHMNFKTPVGTIGIRGTKVFVSYDPVTGDVTILNRPTGTGAGGQVLAGEIVLTLPTGQVIGNMTSGDGGWQWNAAQGQQPQTVQMTPAQVQNLVAGVAGVVNNLQQIQQQQPQQQQNGTQPGGGGDNNGGQGGPGGGQNGQGGNTTTGDAGTTTTTTTNNVTVTTTTTGNGTTASTFNIGASVVVTNNVTTANPTGTTATNPTGTITSTPTTGTTPPPPPPPPPAPVAAQVAVSGGGTVSDHTATSVTFTITRSVNTTSAFSVNYTIGGGTATPGTDFVGGSGTLNFAPNELSKTITVPISATGRNEGAETFSLTLTGATGGATITNNTAPVTITADDPLPIITIGSATVSDKVAGTATLTITRTGALYGPATVAYKTIGGSAQDGSDFTGKTGTVTFAANQATATITIPILANSTPLTSANREGDETFTVVLSDPTDATIAANGGTGTVTISADPALASFSVANGSGSEAAGTATFVITRGGDASGTVTVDYSLVPGSAFSGTDFSGSGGTVTFGPNELSKTITVTVVGDTTPEGSETFGVLLSNPNGGQIANGSATVTIVADPVPEPDLPSPTILGAYSGNSYAQVPGSASQIVSGSVVNVSSHTVEAWVRLSTDQGNGNSGQPQTIAAFPGGSSMYFMYQPDHHLSVQLGDGSGFKKIVSSVTVSPDAWHHVAYTYNQTTGDLKLYIDGVEDTAVTHPNNDTLAFNSSTSFFAGGGATPFQGGLDEVRLWDNVRTDTQIHDNANIALPSTTQHLLIQYSFDNFSGSVVTNTGIGGVSLNGSTSNTFRSPHDGDRTLLFDGATHLQTDITQAQGGFTLQASIRLFQNGGTGGPIFAKNTVAGGADENLEYMLFVDSSNHIVLRIGHGSGNGYTDYVGQTLLAGLTYDVAATFNPIANQVAVYVNGVQFVTVYDQNGSQLASGSSTPATAVGMKIAGNQALDIGHNYDGSDRYFTGFMTNVRVWDGALPQANIQTSNSMGVPLDGPGLIAFYTFNNGTGTTVPDLSGNGHAATITGTANYVFDGAPQIGIIETSDNTDEDTGGSVQLVGTPGTAGATLTYSLAAGPAHGTVTVSATGFVTYMPALNFNGTDSFTVRLTDSAGGTTTQTVNFTIDPVNDRPKIALAQSLGNVTVDDTNPTGYTIDSKFGGSFVDPDGTFVGVAVLANTANTSTQGNWQFSLDGSTWYNFGAITTAAQQVLLSKNTYIRFVPVMGYTGSPGGLIIRAVDSNYAGTFTTNGASPYTLANAGAAMLPILLSAAPTFVFVTVGATVVPANASWDAGGGDGNWNTAANWDGNVAPGAGTAVTIGGSATVLLDGGAINNAASLTLTGTAILTIDNMPMATELALTGNATLGAGTQLTMEDASVLSSVGGSLNNSGTIYVPEGEAATLDFKAGAINNLTTDSVIRVMGDLTVEGPLNNAGVNTGHGILIQATDSSDATLMVTNGNLTNTGDISLSGVNFGAASPVSSSATLHVTGFIDNSGTITVANGSYAGGRFITGNVRNATTGNIDVLADTFLNGGMQNAGTINIGGGKTLSYSGSSFNMTYSGNNGALTGAGILWMNDTGNSDAYFITPSNFTLVSGLTLLMGSYAGNNGARWMANGVTVMDGTVNVNSAIFEGSTSQFILDGTMNVVGDFEPSGVTNTNNIHTSLSLTGTVAGWTTNTYAFKIASTGVMNVTGGGLNTGSTSDDELVNIQIDNGFKNDGTITISSAGADVGFYISAGNYSNANPDDVNNNLAYNTGTIDIQGGGGARYFNVTDMRNSGVFLVHTDTSYTGRFTNTGTFTIYGGATLTVGDNSRFNLGGAWTYAGTGTSTLHVRGGDESDNNAHSQLNLTADTTIGANMELIVGDFADGNNYNGHFDHDAAVVDTSVGQTTVLTVTGGGTLELRNGGIGTDVVVQSGSTVTATGRNGTQLGRNVTINNGGELNVLNEAGLSIGNIGFTTEVNSTGTIRIEDSDSDGFGTTATFLGTVVNNNLIQLVNSGNGVDMVTADIEGTFTIADGGTFNIGSYNVFLGNDSALLTTDPGGNLVISNNSLIDVHRGTLALNLDAGVTNYSLVTGATFNIGNQSTGVDAHLTGLQTNSSPITLDVFGTLNLDRADVTTLLDVKSGGLIKTTDGVASLNKSLNVSSGGNLTVQATVSSGTSAISVVNAPVSNSGTITLDGTLGQALFQVTGSTFLTNNASGVINVTGGTAMDQGAFILAKMDNSGTVSVQATLRFDPNGFNWTNQNGSSFTIASGKTMYFEGSVTPNTNFMIQNTGATFNMNTGSTLLMNGSGIYFGSANETNSGTIYMGDGIDQGGNGFANDTDGGNSTIDNQLTLSGGELNMEGGTLTVGGALNIATLGSFTGIMNILSSGSLNVGSGNFNIYGGNVHKSTSGSLSITSGGAIDIHAGTLTIDTASAFNLVSGANIYVGNSGTGDMGYLAGSQSGPDTTINVSGLIDLNLADISVFLNVQNGGQITVADGTATLHDALTISGASGSVILSGTSTLNANGGISNAGIFDIGVGSTVIMNNSNISNTGSIVVNGDLWMGTGSSGSATGGGSITDSGTITGNGEIHFQGGSYNGQSGGSLPAIDNITISPGNSPGHLTIDGDLSRIGRLNIELAGTQRNQYDLLSVTGHYALSGTLAVISYAGFQAAAGQQFDVVSWNTREGMFQDADGLDAMHGVGLDINFTDHGLTLVAKAITAEGTEGADVLIGTDQSDVIVSHGGGDVLDGGLGDDLLIGGSGDDVLKGGAGDNHLIGGQGTDTVDYSTGTTGVHVDLYNGTASNGQGGTDTLISIEKIIGTAHDDIIAGSAKAEVIIGGAGNDIIAGKGGADILTGGAGNDTFVLHSPHEAGATITDFTTGQDVIELNAAAFGFAPNTDVNACFSVIAGHFDGTTAGINAAFTAGHAALIYSQADHALYCDTNGAGEGYTTVVTLQSGAQVAATDVHLVSTHAA